MGECGLKESVFNSKMIIDRILVPVIVNVRRHPKLMNI